MEEYKARTGAHQFPPFEELQRLLEQESHREVPLEKLQNPRFDLSCLNDLYAFFGLENKIHTIQKVSEFLSWSEQSKQVLVEKILNNSEVSYELVGLLTNLYNYLAEEDPLPEDLVADSIFVFGSNTNLRTEKAIDLYKKKLGQTITISGHKAFYKDAKTTEAEVLGQFAIDEGVPKDVIILEKQGLSMADNVKRTLDLWEQMNKNIKSLIIVCSPFAMRRAYEQWLKYPSFDLKLYRQNSIVGDQYNAEKFYKDSYTLKIVLNEYYKLQGERLIDLSLHKFGWIT